MLAKEKMLCPDGNAEIRKVEATYFVETPHEKKSGATDNGMKIISYPANYGKDADTGADAESETVRSTIE